MFVSCLENDHPGNAASGLKCENVVRAGFVLPRTGYSTILCSKYFHGFMTCSEFVLHLLVVLYLPRMMNTIHTNQAQQSYGIFSTC